MNPTDSELLKSFVDEKDEHSFESLVRRHGPMVLAACRRLTADEHLAQEAFQATFLVLSRKAGSLRNSEVLASWLYQVAYRVTSRLRGTTAQRREKEISLEEVPDMPAPETDSSEWSELRPLLDEELNKMPAKYRSPLVLCFLEGKSNEEAAEILNWPAGSMSRRVAKAKELLRERLTGRGLVLTTTVLFTLLSEKSRAATLPSALLNSTTKAATLFAANQAASGIISAKVTALTEATMKAMFQEKLKFAAITILIFVTASLVTGVMARQVMNSKPATKNQQAEPQKTSPLTSTVVQSKQITKPTAKPSSPLAFKSIDEYIQRFQAALRLKDRPKRWQTIRDLGINLSDEQFEKAVTEYDPDIVSPKEKEEEERTDSLYTLFFERAHCSIIKEWAHSDPPSAAQWSFHLQAFPLSKLNDRSGDLDFPQVFSPLSVESSSRGNQAGLMLYIVATWSEIDFNAAFEWAQQLPKENGKIIALTSLIPVWALSDRTAAYDALYSPAIRDLDKENRTQLFCFAMKHMVQFLMKRDPNLTTEWIAQWTQERFEGSWNLIERYLLPHERETFGKGWNDFEASQRWFSNLAPEKSSFIQNEYHQAWIQYLAYQMSKNPKEARRQVNTLAVEDQEKVMELYASMSIRAQVAELFKEPELTLTQAFETIKRDVSDLKLQQEAFEVLMENWAASGEKEANAIEWLNQMPEGNSKQKLLLSFLRHSDGKSNYTARLELIKQIKDKHDQQWLTTVHLRLWLERDQPAATKWIQESSLSQKEKDQWLGAKQSQ
jgi:RNA polymerase sigma factor (sigma-70 family)